MEGFSSASGRHELMPLPLLGATKRDYNITEASKTKGCELGGGCHGQLRVTVREVLIPGAVTAVGHSVGLSDKELLLWLLVIMFRSATRCTLLYLAPATVPEYVTLVIRILINR